jgi:hypothetical protein
MAGLFERIHEELGGGSWLIDRVTGSEYAKAQAYPSHTDQTYPREAWFARRDAKAYGIALDAQGKIREMFGALIEEASSHMTLHWREVDSNPRFPARGARV